MGVATPESQAGMGRRETSGPNPGRRRDRAERAHSFAQWDLWSTPVFQALFSELWVRPWIKQRQGWRLEKADALVTGWGCQEWVLGGASRGKDSRGETAGLRLWSSSCRQRGQEAGEQRDMVKAGAFSSGVKTPPPGNGGQLKLSPVSGASQTVSHLGLGSGHYFSHFRDVETEAQRVHRSAQVVQHGSDGARVPCQTQHLQGLSSWEGPEWGQGLAQAPCQGCLSPAAWCPRTRILPWFSQAPCLAHAEPQGPGASSCKPPNNKHPLEPSGMMYLSG